MALHPITVYTTPSTYVAQQLTTYTDMADVLDFLRTIGYNGQLQVNPDGSWHMWFQTANQNASWNAAMGDWVIVKNGSIASSVPAAQAASLYTTTPPA